MLKEVIHLLREPDKSLLHLSEQGHGSHGQVGAAQFLSRPCPTSGFPPTATLGLIVGFGLEALG